MELGHFHVSWYENSTLALAPRAIACAFATFCGVAPQAISRPRADRGAPDAAALVRRAARPGPRGPAP